MHCGQNIIGKLLTPVNRRRFKRFVDKYDGDYCAKKMSCWEQFVSILLGQFGNCNSLRDIETVVKYHKNSQKHLGLRQDIARSTLSDANANRDWRIYRDLFFDLVDNLKSHEKVDSNNIVKIIDSSPIFLKLSQHSWAEHTHRVRGLKLHLVYDLSLKSPTYFEITGAKATDINTVKNFEISPDVTYVFDRGYVDYSFFADIAAKGAKFIIRIKKNNARIRGIEDIVISNKTVSSQTSIFDKKNCNSSQYKGNPMYGKKVRKIIIQRPEDEPLEIITNDFKRSAVEIANLYRQRWQIELFFKWIKQNLKIKKFLGRNENSIKTQICIALISFVLLRLASVLKSICQQMSLKTIITITKNGLFTKIENTGNRGIY